MKILVFSFPRTRSSFLQDCLCKHFGLKDLWEPYANQVYTFSKPKKINPTSDELWDMHKSTVSKITNSIEKEANGVVKLFPNIGYNSYKLLRDKPIIWNKDDFLDSQYFKFDMYDKIYCTTRNNYTEMVCSYRFMRNYNKPLYHADDKQDLKIKKIYERQKIIIPYDDKMVLHDCFEKIVYDIQIKRLKKLNYNLIELEYDEIPTYVEKNFAGVQSKYAQGDFNYTERVKNYYEIDAKIKKTFEDLEPLKRQVELLFPE